jgi:hypothetical protein
LSLTIGQYLVGTKADLVDQRQIAIEEAEQMARQIGGARYFEVSSKKGEVRPDHVMLALTKDFLGQRERDGLTAKRKEVRAQNRKCIVS